jgi:hypothetical protein
VEVTVDAWLRWTRAVVLAAVACLVAVAAHVSADGRLPSASVLLVVCAVLAVAARPLLARPASAVRVVLLTVGGQSLAHAALTATAGHGSTAQHAAPDHHSHAGGAHSEVVPGPAVHDVLTHLVDDVTSAGAPMLLTHLLAAALVGLWLAVGERTVWTLLSLAWRALTLLARRASASLPPAGATTSSGPVAPLLRRMTAGSVVRRGPPLLLAA